MDDKFKEKMEKRTDRHFHIQGDTTYIEHQELTVQSGASFFNGPAPKDGAGNVVKEADLERSLPKTEVTATMNVIEKIHVGVRAVYNSGLIEYDYEYAAVYKAIEELELFDKLSYAEFVDILKDSKAFADDELPTGNNISKIIIKGRYPNWKVMDKGYNVTKKIISIGKCFFEAYNAA